MEEGKKASLADVEKSVNESIMILDNNLYEKDDIVPVIVTKETEILPIEFLLENKPGTLITQMNASDLVFILKEHLFLKYMSEIEKKYKKTNISMLKTALKNNSPFIKLIRENPNGVYKEILLKCYEHYKEKIEKSNKNKEERKKRKIINKLVNKKKKDMTGCMIKKITHNQYEDCLKNAGHEDYKYASTMINNDSLIDEMFKEKLKEGKEKQAENLLSEVFKKKK